MQRPTPVPASSRSRSRWLKVLAWVAAIVGVFILFLMIAAALLLRSRGAHEYLLRTVQQKATAALGTQVRFHDFSFRLSGLSPSVDIYQVQVQGAPPFSDLPLAQADALHLQVTIISLLRRSWYVNDIRIDHPVVHMFVDASGKTNLPAAQSTPEKSSQTNVFDLGIRHLALIGGQIYYNDRKSDLTADLQQLMFRSEFDPTAKRYAGTISYKDGHVRLGNTNPLPHSFDGRFWATPEEFTLESAELRTASSRISLSGKMRDYASPNIEAEYKALVDASEFRKALRNASLPEGKIQLNGKASYASRADRPLLAVVVVNGDATSSALTASAGGSRAVIKNLAAQYSLANGDAKVSGFRADVLGGVVNGTLSIRNLTGSTRSQLSAAVHGISVAEAQKTLAPASMARANLNGAVNATATASWGKTMEDLIARADASLQSGIPPQHGQAAIPITGIVHATYNARSAQISLANSYVRSPQTFVTLNGTVSNSSVLKVELHSAQLHDLEDLAATFRPAGSAPIGVYGKGSVIATVRGSTSNPQISGQVAADDLRVKGSSWKSLRASIFASPSEARIEHGELNPTSRGRISFDLATKLTQWSPEKSSEFRGTLNASQVSAADLVKAAGLSTPVKGEFSADISVNGTQLAPTGHGTLRLTRAEIAGEPLQEAKLQFEGQGTLVTANLQVELPKAGTATATVKYQPREQTYDGSLRAVGIKLDQLETLKQRNLQIAGILNATASGKGTLQDPQLQAQVEVPQLNIRDQVIKDLRFQGTAANHKANFTLNSQVIQSYIRAQGAIALSGDYNADVSLDSQAISFAPLLAAYAPSQATNISGQTELHATLRGPLKDRARLEAHVVVPQLSMNYKNVVQIAAATPIRADYTGGVLNVQRSVIRGTGTEINFQARIPTAKDAPISLLVRGGLDLRLAQLISPDITSGGQVQFDIDSFGSRADPNVQGLIKIVNASFATIDTPLGLQNGNGVLTLTRDRLNVTQFQGKVGGGDISASGGVIYRPDLRFDLGLTGNGVRILYAQSVRTSISPNLSLSGNFTDAVLQGEVGIEDLSFTEDFDLMQLMSQFGGEATPPPSQGFTQDLRLQVGITTPGGLNLSSRTLSVAGSANLQVRGTAAQPVLLGRLNLSGGDLIFSGNRYVLQGGTVDFRNPSRTEPVLDMAVNTTIDQYDIQMRFWGPADHLHTNYASDPTLPPADIINLIAFGKTSEAAAANPTPSGSLGAQSLIASQVSNQVTGRIEKLAGISQLSIDPVLGDGQHSAGARVAIQQRVTSKVFVTFSTDVTGTQKQVVKLEYHLNNRTSFDVVRDQNGGFSFQTSLRKRW